MYGGMGFQKNNSTLISELGHAYTTGMNGLQLNRLN